MCYTASDVFLRRSRSCELRFNILSIRRAPFRWVHNTSPSEVRKDGSGTHHWTRRI